MLWFRVKNLRCMSPKSVDHSLEYFKIISILLSSSSAATIERIDGDQIS